MRQNCLLLPKKFLQSTLNTTGTLTKLNTWLLVAKKTLAFLDYPLSFNILGHMVNVPPTQPVPLWSI